MYIHVPTFDLHNHLESYEKSFNILVVHFCKVKLE